MDLSLLALVILVVTSAGSGVNGDTSRCPPTVHVTKFVKTFKESCFQFIRNEVSWYGAHDSCRSKGGHLVTVRDKATQDFLMRTLREYHWPANGIWLGASDRENEMDWKWVTNHRVKYGYKNWAPGQPSCHFLCFEDCAQMRLDEGGQWHDFKCDWVEDYSYICQYPLLPKTTTLKTTSTTPSTTTTITTLTTNTTPTTTTIFRSTATLTPSVHNLTNDTSFLVTRLPDIEVELLSKTQLHQLWEDSEDSQSSKVSIIGLALGLLCVFLVLLVVFFIFFRRNKKKKEEVPKVFFSNPYYADATTPLNHPSPTDEEGEDSCCAGVSFSQAPTPVKRPIYGPPIPKRVANVYSSTPTLADHKMSPALAGNYYDEITAHKMLYTTDGTSQNLSEEEGAVGGMYDEANLVDNHYDTTTGENFYETVDNVRLAIEQNAVNEQQEERYVPFQFDSPAPPSDE